MVRNAVIAVLFLCVVALIGLQVHTVSGLRSVESKLALVEDEQTKIRDAADKEVGRLKESAATAGAEQQKALAAIRKEVDQAGRQAQGIAGKVKEEAMKSVEDLATRVSVTDSKIQDQQETQAKVATEITGLKQATTTAQSEIVSVSSEVNEVKTDVAATRSQMERTIADLRRTTGDLNVLSGLIATNAREIAALRQLGDRNYIDFTLFKRKDAVKVGDVSVLLKQADVKVGRYTIELRVDDRTIEKKDRFVNEPVQFYVGRNLQPDEFVVNLISKDQITGYLATPKVPATRP